METLAPAGTPQALDRAIAAFIAELILLGIWWIFKLPLGPGVSMLVG